MNPNWRASEADLAAVVAARLVEHGSGVTDREALQLGTYLKTLRSWNERMNLTALRPFSEVVDRLILEPVLAARHLAQAELMIDIGSGGGSPAIPLKVLMPHVELCMVESKSRKCAFLREVARLLALTKTTILTGRYESVLASRAYDGRADVVSIRAVRVDASSLVALERLLRPGGRFLLFRGEETAEIGALLPPHWNVERDEPLVPSLGSRLLVIKPGDVPRGTTPVAP